MNDKNHELTEAQISAAGRALADRSADSCGVNRDDNWMIYGSEFIEDARVAFAAAAQAAPAAPVQTAVPFGWNIERKDCADVGRYIIGDGASFRSISAEDEPTMFRFLSALVATPVQAEQAQAEPEPVSDDTAEFCARRLKNFSVNIDQTYNPDFKGEKSIIVTYNGRQRYPFALAPHEARKVFNLLASEFGFSPVAALPAQAEQVEAVRAAYENAAKVADGFYDHIRQYTTDVPAIGSAIRALAAPSTATSKEGADHA